MHPAIFTTDIPNMVHPIDLIEIQPYLTAIEERVCAYKSDTTIVLKMSLSRLPRPANDTSKPLPENVCELKMFADSGYSPMRTIGDYDFLGKDGPSGFTPTVSAIASVKHYLGYSKFIIGNKIFSKVSNYGDIFNTEYSALFASLTPTASHHMKVADKDVYVNLYDDINVISIGIDGKAIFINKEHSRTLLKCISLLCEYCEYTENQVYEYSLNGKKVFMGELIRDLALQSPDEAILYQDDTDCVRMRATPDDAVLILRTLQSLI